MATPVVTSVSHATRPIGSSARMASRTASEIWSASLSGWPSVTDSEVKRYRDGITGGLYMPGLAAQQRREAIADNRSQLLLRPHSRRYVALFARKNGRQVRLRPEPRSGSSHLIHHNEVEVLLGELPPAFGFQVAGLRGEPDEHLTLFLLSEGRKDVGGRLQNQRGWAIVLLQLPSN